MGSRRNWTFGIGKKMSKEKRYIILECTKYWGSFIVIDTKTDKEIRFKNLASARTHIRMREKEELHKAQCWRMKTIKELIDDLVIELGKNFFNYLTKKLNGAMNFARGVWGL